MRVASLLIVVVMLGLGCSRGVRPIHPQLSAERIDALPPEALASEAHEAILKALSQDWSEAELQLRALPGHWRLVHTTLNLEAEVNNGGFHQFFWNTEGGFNAETLDDLRRVDAEPYVSLFDSALAVFSAHDYRSEKAAAGNDWSAFKKGYDEKRLEALDQAFFDAEQKAGTIATYVGKYIKGHADAYTH